jgi:Uncharacterized conserved protein (COG2071)
MRLPVICGVIDRRLLINYRVDPGVLAAILPKPFRPQVVRGFGMAGICLIRLRHVRPKGFPSWMGIDSENAAHRVAVEWEEGHERRSGVYIFRRDTNSILNALAGGRVFPGIHQHGVFHVHETDERFEVAVDSNDRKVLLHVVAKVSDAWPGDSVFDSLEGASSFYEAGSLGYSPSTSAGRFQGLELRCRNWRVEPLSIGAAKSSLFDEESLFPRGSIELDNGLLMRGVEHEWHSREDVCCREVTQADAPAMVISSASR